MTSNAYQLIDTPEAVQAWLAGLEDAPCLAVDFEADGLFSYREKLCLIQVTDRGKNRIIDPLAVPEMLSGFAPLLADPDLPKVFHGADYDVRLWKRAIHSPLRGLFDTMIAAQFCGRGQVGLAALLAEFFDLTLDKRYQKANWGKRPLEPGMLEYAALDTAYLIPLREILEKELEQLGRLAWAEEEFRLLEAAEPSPPKTPSCFEVKGSRRFAPRQLAALQALLEVREAAAAERDHPPFKVLNNAVLLAWVENPPRSRTDLLATPGANRGILGRLATPVLDALEGARTLAPDACPRPPNNGPFEPLTAAQEKRLKRLKQARAARAEQLQLPVGLLVNTATLERLTRQEPEALPDAVEAQLKNWQREVLGAEITAAARG
ncbi:MAG TPA: HRDC domain-containing protein [Deferrisomatales bacterium]|nr:HRDC domain-containing protein [Deferrisomatales bacterium]